MIRIYRDTLNGENVVRVGFFISFMCLHMLLKLESAGKICNFSILQVKFNKFVILKKIVVQKNYSVINF